MIISRGGIRVLIRYTSSKYKEDYLNGNLYLSSLSSFWDVKKGKIDLNKTPNPTAAEIQAAMENQKMMQQDFSEGAGGQIPKSAMRRYIKNPEFQEALVYDMRYRVEAYGYCNLLCFYRMDQMDCPSARLDEKNVCTLLRQKGAHVSGNYLSRLNPWQLNDLLQKYFPQNPKLSQKQCHIIQLPPPAMDQYGDMVVLVKDESAFIKKIKTAVKNRNEDCVLGDVRYHEIQDRDNHQNEKNPPHTISLVEGNHFWNLSELKREPGLLQYGPLDKYSPFSWQKEWRVCWLPQEHNHEGKVLEVGDLRGIIETVSVEEFRWEMMKRNPGYVPGYIERMPKNVFGTMRDGERGYRNFMEAVEQIDGRASLMVDVGVNR